jgi:hypothetical protein
MPDEQAVDMVRELNKTLESLRSLHATASAVEKAKFSDMIEAVAVEIVRLSETIDERQT